MSLPPEIAASVERTRERVRAKAGPPADDGAVQLAVRLPLALREQVHRAAAASGAASTQEWLQAVISTAVADALDPQRRLAVRLRESMLSHLAEQIDDGTWDAVIADIAAEDPDLA